MRAFDYVPLRFAAYFAVLLTQLVQPARWQQLHAELLLCKASFVYEQECSDSLAALLSRRHHSTLMLMSVWTAFRAMHNTYTQRTAKQLTS